MKNQTTLTQVFMIYLTVSSAVGGASMWSASCCIEKFFVSRFDLTRAGVYSKCNPTRGEKTESRPMNHPPAVIMSGAGIHLPAAI
jgi:hypothetical protein